jgi:hypothetical protein
MMRRKWRPHPPHPHPHFHFRFCVGRVGAFPLPPFFVRMSQRRTSLLALAAVPGLVGCDAAGVPTVLHGEPPWAGGGAAAVPTVVHGVPPWARTPTQSPLAVVHHTHAPPRCRRQEGGGSGGSASVGQFQHSVGYNTESSSSSCTVKPMLLCWGGLGDKIGCTLFCCFTTVE